MIIVLICGVSISITAQSPCTNPPNGEGCLCSTAGVLCTPDELDGFTFSMSSTSNDGDLPDGGFNFDLCPGNSQDGFPNNVNFFAFVVWCEDLTFDVQISNCQDNPGDGQESYGVQMAMFASCGSQASGWDPVLCLTDGFEYCHDDEADVPAVQTFSTTGLEIGNTYYFMLDGCAGSVCDITIDVVGVCGTGMIDDWTTGIEGPTEVCVGETYNYITEDLNGAEEFYYYLDGVLIEDGDELQIIDLTFDMEGTYTLCVDVSNLPCILESDDPDQYCIDINAFEPDAGDLVVDPQTLCPGETSNVTVSNYNANPELSLYIVVIGPDGLVTQVVDGDNTTVTYDECGVFTVYAYNFITADVTDLPIVGEAWTPPNCDIDCCDLEEEMISFEDTELPVFTDPPNNETYTCNNDVPPLMDLDWTDNCDGAGSVEGMESGTSTLCDGGEITRDWEYTDLCGNTATFTQIITIDPTEEADWVDAPGPITVSCDAVPTTHPDLMYTNNGTGDCLIEGTVPAVTMTDTTICGGTITNTWEFTDDCGRTINHEQVITVTPPDEPTFQSMPADVTLNCGDVIPPAEDVLVSNNAPAGCLIEELITPTETDNTDPCGGTIERLYEYSDICGTDLSFTQVITINPPDEPIFDSSPMDMTVSCADFMDAPDDLMYSNSMTGACLIEGTVEPQVDDNTSVCGGTIEYTWEFTDDCGRMISENQVITIEPAPEPMFLDTPEDITIDCGEEEITPENLSYTNMGMDDCAIMGTVSPTQTGEFTVCGGDVEFLWEFTDECNITIMHTQTITINPADPPIFIDVPEDITVACSDFDDDPPMLDYDNDLEDECEISGSVDGELDGTPGPCGETLQFTWTFTDECGNTIDAAQNITLEAASMPDFQFTPPADVTVQCDEVPSDIDDLVFTNNEIGFCAISGVIQGIQSGIYDNCGGSISFNWNHIDECGNTLSHVQLIEVLPASEPEFVDLPPDITLGCEDEVPDPLPLEYTNNEVGACLIQGFVDPTVISGPQQTEYIWTYINDCTGEEISHTQIISGVSIPDIVINPIQTFICQGDAFDLADIDVTDLNGQSLTLEYFILGGAQVTNTLVSPFETTSYLIVATNEDGCQDEEIFTLIIETPPNAGGDGSLIACASFGTYNLFNYLQAPFDQNGSWFDIDNSGASIDDPFAANFSGVLPGTYMFEYSVPSGNTCPPDVAILTIEVIAELEIEAISIECDPSGGSYNVVILSNGYDITSSAGDTEVIDDNTVEITNIPIGELVVVTGIDPISFCITDIFVNSPNCDCPDIPSPVSNGNQTICIGDEIPELSVTVASGLMANWYDNQAGNIPLVENSLTYTPEVSAPGTYTFYVEAEDANGCVSLIRTPVILEVINIPIANDASASLCEDDNGEAIFDLSMLNEQVNPNTSFSYTYFANQSDAENDENTLSNDFIVDSSPTTITVKVISGSGCINYAQVTLSLDSQPSFDLTAQDEVCLGDNNGMISISNIDPPGTQFSINGFDYFDVIAFDSLAPDSYTIYAESPLGCQSEAEISIIEGIQLTVDEIMIECNSNNTPTISSDDSYAISFSVANNNASSGMMEVFVEGSPIGTFGYGDVSISEPADGMDREIRIVDVNTGCEVTFTTNELTPCSTDCELTPDTPIFECNDNGSPTDDTDDYYIVTVNATAINGAVTNSYNVSIAGESQGNFIYGTAGTFQIPANGENVILTYTDNDDDQCFATVPLGNLDPCSNACTFDVDLEYSCDANGTTGIEGDDFYLFTFSVSGQNLGANYNLYINAILENTYIYGETYDIMLPADGSVNVFLFEDISNTDCSESIDIDPLEPCSGNCEIAASLIDVECNNSGTADDPSDDVYTATILVETIDGSDNWIIEDIAQGGQNGINTEVGPFLLIDGIIQLTIQDENIASCQTILEITPPDPCSICDETVEAGADGVLDCDITFIELMGSSDNPGEGLWTGPGGFMEAGYNATTEIPGIYYFSVDFGEECVATDSLEIVVSDEIPVANAGPQMNITCEVDTVILVGSVSGGTNDISVAWYDELGQLISDDFELIVSSPGNYYFEVTDNITGCSSPQDVVSVEDLTAGPSAVIYADPGNILDCVVEVIYLTSENEPNVVYSWLIDNQPASGEITIIEPADIMLIALDTLTGCQNDALLEITTLEEYPLVELQPAEDLNCVTTEITLDGTNSQNSNSISYTWYDNLFNIIATDVNQITVTDTGAYYLQLIDANNGCENIDTVIVGGEFEYPVVLESSDVQLRCDDNTIAIGIMVEGDQDEFTYNWQSLDGNIVGPINDESIDVNAPGIYIVDILDIASQCLTKDTILVEGPQDILGVALDIYDESCADNQDGSIIIASASGGTPPFTYTLDNEEILEEIISGLSAGTYALEISDSEGCEFDTMITVEVLENFEIDLTPEITITEGQTTTLTALVNIDPDEIQSIQWIPSEGLSCDTCLTTTLTGNIDIDMYRLVIIDENGCEAEASVRIIVDQIVEVFFPNIISPNDDNNGNDYFFVTTSKEGLIITKFQIFDRWGELIHSGENLTPNIPEQGWDGQFKGEDVVPGVYVYRVEMLFLDGNLETYSGDITVLR